MLFDVDKEEQESESGDDLSEREDSWPQTQNLKEKPKTKSHNFKKQSVESEILAARQSRGWQDFVKTGSVAFGITEEDRSKRTRRMIMIG